MTHDAQAPIEQFVARQLGRVPWAPVLAALVIATSVSLVHRGHQQSIDEAHRQAGLYTRVLAEHTARAFQAVDLLSDVAIERTAAMSTHGHDGADLQRALSELTMGQPLVRSLSVVSDAGLVLASSQPQTQGLHLAPLASLNWTQPLTLAAGRDLVDARADLGASRQRVLLAAHRLPAAEGVPPRWLLVALNHDHLSTQHELILDSPDWSSAVVALDGRVLAATSNFAAEPGARLAAWARDEVAERGLLDAPQRSQTANLGAWRLTRQFPLRVQVEIAQAQALADWQAQAQLIAMTAAASLAALWGVAAFARRSSRIRQLAEAESRKARQQLREQFEITEQLVDAMAVPVFLTDLAGNLLLTNLAWIRLMGLDQHGLGLEAEHRRDKAIDTLLSQGIDQVLQGGLAQWPLDLLTAHGGVRETEVTKVALRGQGDAVTGIIGTVIEVTHLKQAVRATETARQAAEELASTRAQFVANVTHELRTPLQSILGFAELGSDRADEQARFRAMFLRIHQAGTRMLRLVDDLLDMSRIGSTVGSVRLKPGPLAAPVLAVVDELRPLAAKNGILLQVAMDSALQHTQCALDATRIQQVVRNLLANALRFAPEGSTVTTQLEVGHGTALVSVSDRGPGVPEAELESIFAPFVQSSRTQDGSGGTGLGLAISRKIMQAHNGFISAANRPQGGAVFRLGLPLAAASLANDAAAEVPGADAVDA